MRIGEIVHQVARHGNLVFRCLAQAHADGIADAIRQEGTYTHRRLNTSVLAFAGFGDSQVERIVHPFACHPLDKQADGIDHDACVGRLDRDDDIHKLLRPSNPQKLHDRLHHSLRCVTVTIHHPFAERTVVDTDADGSAILAAYIKEP